jgi:hypothetical protein
MDEPWTTEEFPKAAEWVKLMDNHLDRLVEGSKRSEYYTPYTVLIDPPEGKEESPLLKVSLESLQEQRPIARGLKLRAMQRLGTADLDGAWKDLQAIRRTSRHVAGGWTPIESLVACELDSFAFDGERQVLQNSALTAEQARQFLANLQDVPPLPPLAEIWNVGQRFIILDGLQHSVRLDPDNQGTPIDWDLALRTVNHWCDRLMAASSEKDLEKQKQMFRVLEEDLGRLKTKYETGQWKEELADPDNVAQVLGLNMGEQMSCLMMPAFNKTESAQDRADARLDLIRIGFAAEIFHRQSDRFPNTLSELIPDYVDAIPFDPISGDDLIYRPSDNGALIYSIGHNGQDEDGQFSSEKVNAGQGPDDITVAVGETRLPQPADGDSKTLTAQLLILGAVALFAMMALIGLISFMRARKKATPHPL